MTPNVKISISGFLSNQAKPAHVVTRQVSPPWFWRDPVWVHAVGGGWQAYPHPCFLENRLRLRIGDTEPSSIFFLQQVHCIFVTMGTPFNVDLSLVRFR